MALPSLGALLELDEMAMDDFYQAFEAGVLFKPVVFLSESELNSSLLKYGAVFDDMNATCNSRSEFSI